MYSGRVHTRLAMNTGRKTKPSSWRRMRACKQDRELHRANCEIDSHWARRLQHWGQQQLQSPPVLWNVHCRCYQQTARLPPAVWGSVLTLYRTLVNYVVHKTWDTWPSNFTTVHGDGLTGSQNMYFPARKYPSTVPRWGLTIDWSRSWH